MELATYVAALRRHWILLLATTLAGVLAAGVVALSSERRYESTATVVFGAQNAGSGQDIAYAGNYVQSRMQTYRGLATTPTVLEPVLADLELESSVGALAEQVSIATSQISTLMEVSVTDPDARRAALVADAIAAEVIEAVDALENPDDALPGAPRVRGVVAAPAVVADDPSEPRIPFALLVGALLGLGAGLGVAAARHLLRQAEQA